MHYQDGVLCLSSERPTVWEFELVETTDPELYFRVFHAHTRKVWKIPVQGHPEVHVADATKAKGEVWAFVKVPQPISNEPGQQNPHTAAGPRD